MNILDENLMASQRFLLDAWGIRYRRIGEEVGWLGMQDENEIIPLLHSLRQPTFFTRDRDFYRAKLRHAGYCLVFLDVTPLESAHFIRRVLRYKLFRTQAQRMGNIVCADNEHLRYWPVGAPRAQKIAW